MSACGDAQCVWSHESSILSSEFPLELRRAISHEVVCASCIVPGCRAQVALCKLLHASALCKLLCASALSKFLCASALRQLLRASALRMCSAQVGLCKLLCASCSVQALCACALCRLLCASALSKLLCASALRQLLRASALRMCSVQVGLCKLLCASALCSVQFAERKLLCASDSAQVALRKCCRSCGNVLRVLLLYLKVAIFQPGLQEHAPRTTFVLKSCDFQAGAAADQGGIEPATAGLRKQARQPRDNFQRPFREQQIRTAPQRERFDTHDPRPQSVARAC